MSFVLVTILGIASAIPSAVPYNDYESCKAALDQIAVESVVSGKSVTIQREDAFKTDSRVTGILVNTFDKHYCVEVK